MVISDLIPWVNYKGGRFLIVEGLINKMILALVGIYAPHTNQIYFFPKFIQHLGFVDDTDIIIMGDFNGVFDSGVGQVSFNLCTK